MKFSLDLDFDTVEASNNYGQKLRQSSFIVVTFSSVNIYEEMESCLVLTMPGRRLLRVSRKKIVSRLWNLKLKRNWVSAWA